MSNKDKGFASMDKDKVTEIAAKGGHASHSNNRENNKDQDNGNDNNLSEAGHKMRSGATHEERSEAASKMGKVVGEHSHDGDRKNKDHDDEK
ncbi:MAG: hypothetical protein H0U78_04875 [Rickettsiaceae bacterium]|jgi:general stress protein YciG|nr:hypothetical protein [Rickettsiaceae bacterium]